MPELLKHNTKSDTTRTCILDAAAGLFRAQGYAAVSLRAIAAAAGMKAGSLYYHFASKEAIVAEVLDAGIFAVHEEVRRAIALLPKDASTNEILRVGIRGHLSALLEHSDYTSANVRIFGQVPEPVQRANLPIRRAYEKIWDDLLLDLKMQGKLRSEVDIRAFRQLLIGAMNATLDWFDPAKGGTDMLADSYTDILINGLLVSKACKP